MAMHLNRWSPDTCGCVFDYQWDDSLPADQRVHTLSQVINVCTQHQTLGLISDNHYTGVLNENVRKNKVHGQLLTISTLSQLDGNSNLVFKDGMGFNYTWTGTDGSRVLNITVFGANLTNAQKTAVQNWCNTNLGVGKVIVN